MPLYEDNEVLRQRLQLRLVDVGISTRTCNALEGAGIYLVNDLLQSSPAEILEIKNLGDSALDEVYAALEKYDFYRDARLPPTLQGPGVIRMSSNPIIGARKVKRAPRSAPRSPIRSARVVRRFETTSA